MASLIMRIPQFHSVSNGLGGWTTLHRQRLRPPQLLRVFSPSTSLSLPYREVFSKILSLNLSTLEHACRVSLLLTNLSGGEEMGMWLRVKRNGSGALFSPDKPHDVNRSGMLGSSTLNCPFVIVLTPSLNLPSVELRLKIIFVFIPPLTCKQP